MYPRATPLPAYGMLPRPCRVVNGIHSGATRTTIVAGLLTPNRRPRPGIGEAPASMEAPGGETPAGPRMLPRPAGRVNGDDPTAVLANSRLRG